MRGPAPLLAAIALVAGIAGCSKPSADPPKNAANSGTNVAANAAGDEAGNGPAEPVNVGTTAGSADKRDEKTGKKLYSIAWKSALIAIGEGGIQSGTMNSVRGTIYQDEKPKSTFSADTGYAVKKSQTLRLEKRVTVRSATSTLVLTAQKLEWLPNVKRLRASGNVVVTDGSGRVEAPVLEATADLRKVGTPDAFDRLPNP